MPAATAFAIAAIVLRASCGGATPVFHNEVAESRPVVDRTDGDASRLRGVTAGASTAMAWMSHGVGAALRLLRFPLTRRVHDERRVVERAQGRQVLTFPIREPAPLLFVNISGRVQFERADIGFADGAVESVDAYGLDRGTGLYELARYERARSVEFVRLVLRARSRQARVGICIGV